VQVVILAAGMGQRLGALTRSRPKALVRVAGRPLVAHALGFAARLDPARIVVVGGAAFERLAAEIERMRGAGEIAPSPPVTLVENPRFRDGNLLSLLAARAWLDDDTVLMNVDHVFSAAVSGALRPPPPPEDGIVAFIDTDRTLGADDMKVERDGQGRLRAISKTLPRFDAGYVGLTRIARGAIDLYARAADAAVAAEGPSIPVERVLDRLAAADSPPACRDVSGLGWVEVDTPADHLRAEDFLRAGT
jgi:choline kinase